MAWWQWKSIVDDQRIWAATYYALPPDACPRCGTPLDVGQTTAEVGSGKEMLRHCPMGHYNWQGGTRET